MNLANMIRNMWPNLVQEANFLVTHLWQSGHLKDL